MGGIEAGATGRTTTRRPQERCKQEDSARRSGENGDLRAWPALSNESASACRERRPANLKGKRRMAGIIKKVCHRIG